METRTLLSGIAIGAAAALMLDPNRGARRRALMRDKAIRTSRVTGEVLDTTMHDFINRTHGVSEARGWIFDRHVDDPRLLKRVRARIGRVCSHPHAIDVEVQDGQVTLRGPVLAAEVKNLLSTAATVRGVGSVINELDPHDTADGIPALQGSTGIAGAGLDLQQPNWAPAIRALLGAVAVAASGVVVAYVRR